MKHQMSCCQFLCFFRGLTRGLLKTIERPSSFVASYLHFSAVSVQFHNCNDSDTRVAKRLRVPTMGLRDILHQAKGGSFWLSPLRSDGSQDDWAGEAGPVEL
jgi:hypothetical protein